MNLSVKFYKDVPNAPKGMPEEWPADVLEIQEGGLCPSGWTEMSRDEYAAYRDEHAAKYNAYLQGHDPNGKWRVGKLPHHYVKRAWRKMTGKF